MIAYDRSTVHQSKSQDSSLRSSERSIFISYRRSDSRHVTRKIYDLLAAYFGHERVFRDLDSIPPGETFKEYIEHELHQCQILIAVIGSTWLESTDRNGHRRLDNPNDWVRLEIEFALNRGIRVIPLLINDAKMPQADELPGLLKDLHTRNAVRMRHAFGLNRRDIGRLIGNCEILLSDTYEK
ncbi:MAG: toll/interleukin-1 receptor domain-containing protein [Leptolyngbyaceae cyanobacterium MO_188.B28]|nr:toll/interleukin-1 receptor domain-containing protein [Leptolyngbyaceae cyanobacterium MO_188.B28]